MFLQAVVTESTSNPNIPIIIGGIVTIITLITASILQIMAAYKVVRVVNDQMSVVQEIKSNVDGHLTAALQELADSKKLLAIQTGLDADKIRAEDAQKRTDTQALKSESARKDAEAYLKNLENK